MDMDMDREIYNTIIEVFDGIEYSLDAVSVAGWKVRQPLSKLKRLLAGKFPAEKNSKIKGRK